jgi:hypothetical protein
MVRYADTKETTPNATSALYVYDTKNYRKITTIKSDRSFNRIFSDGYKVIVDERSHRGYLPHGWHNPPEYKIYDLRSGKHISTLEYKEAKYKQTIGDSESGNYLKHELNESSVTLSGNYAFILSKVKEVSKRYVEVFDVTSGKKMGTIEPPNAHYHFGPIPGSALAASMKATDKKLIIEGYIKNSDIDKPKQLLSDNNLCDKSLIFYIFLT